MTATTDKSSMDAPDWHELRPQLRQELSFRPQRIAGRLVYVVEDPTRTRFFRLGRREYLFAAALDGTVSAGEALAGANRALADQPLTESNARAILHWAAQNDLLETNRQQDQLRGEPSRREEAPNNGRWNPVMFRVPLGSPNHLIARCYPYLSWMLSRWATAAGAIVILLGLAAIFENWARLVESTQYIFTPTGPWSLLACWVALKVLHELAHGLACRRYGGSVREAGLVFIVLLPIAYVDVTSSWRMRSRWQRIHIAAAGMQLELYVAGLAAIVWSLTEPGILNQTCANLVLMASLTTILFNANPLMRFDGYYILTDLLEMPNLAVTAQQWLQGWARRFFFGSPAPEPTFACGRPALTKTYAVAAWLWRLFICGSLIVAAAAMWHGAGIFLAAIAVGAWFGLPLARLVHSFRNPPGPTQPSILRFAAAAMASVCVVGALLGGLPWPGAPRATGIVDYEPLTVVRTEVDGFVEQMLVESGEQVAVGQEIARLKNDQLRVDLSVQQAKVSASQLKIRGLRGRRELAALEAETRQLATQQEHLAELERQVAALSVRAPVAGRVVSRDLQSSVGVFLPQGEPLLNIGSEGHKQVEFSIGQDELRLFAQAEGNPVTVSLHSGAALAGRVARIEPRGSLVPLNAALCAPYGGELLVRQTPETVESKDGQFDTQLLKPHFTGRVVLSTEQSVGVKAGQRAQVSLGRGRRSIGAHLWDWLAQHWGLKG